MTNSFGDWQPGHLHLGAAELYVLLNGPDASATEVFKLALHELIGRGVLKPGIRQQGSGPTTTRTALLLPGDHGPRDLSRPLRSIVDVYDSHLRSSGENSLDVRDLARMLREGHEGKLSQWVTDEFVGALAERGLYTQEQVKRLGLFTTTSYELTPEGKAAQALVESSIERAKDQFSSWAADDRTRAVAFVAVAGPAVLLMPEVRPAIEGLRPASPGSEKLMEAREKTVAGMADRGFDIYRLTDAAYELKTLDDVIDYGRLDQDRTREE